MEVPSPKETSRLEKQLFIREFIEVFGLLVFIYVFTWAMTCALVFCYAKIMEKILKKPPEQVVLQGIWKPLVLGFIQFLIVIGFVTYKYTREGVLPYDSFLEFKNTGIVITFLFSVLSALWMVF